MPTQEQINAANAELQIANDNYAALADRYNKYNAIFQAYKDANPEVQAKARWALQAALDDYQQLKLNMYAAEDRIAQAQNAVNVINEQLATTPSTMNYWGQRRRTTTPPTITQSNSGGQQEMPSVLNWGLSPMSDYSRTLINNTKNIIPATPVTNINTTPSISIQSPNVVPLRWVGNGTGTLTTNYMSRQYPSRLNWVPNRVGYWTLSYPSEFPLRWNTNGTGTLL